MGLMAWTRPPASGDWTRPKDPSTTSTTVKLLPVDLSSPVTTQNPNSMTFSIADQGSDVWRISCTGDGSIRDGVSEGVTLDFLPKDNDGNTVDLTAAKHVVSFEVEVSSASFGDALIVMFGVGERSGGTYQWVRLGGLTTHSSSAIRRSVASGVNSNSTTGTADLEKIRGVYVPERAEDGTMRAGACAIWTLNSSGAPVNKTELTSGSGTISNTVNMALFIGFDSAHTNTKTCDVKISAIASQVWT